MVLLILTGLALLIGLAFPLDTDMAPIFVMAFGGPLLMLAILIFVAERLSRRLELIDAISASPAPTVRATGRHPETENARPLWGYSRALCEGPLDQ